MAKPNNQQKKQQPKGSNQGINVANFFDSATVEYVEDGGWPPVGLSDGVWRVNGKSVASVLFDIVLCEEAWVVRREDGLFHGVVERHFRRALKSERHWCKEFFLSALRGLVEYTSAKIHCSTFRNTPGTEKEKFKAADAASLAFEKPFW